MSRLKRIMKRLGIGLAIRYAAADSLNLVLRAGPINAEIRQQLDQE